MFWVWQALTITARMVGGLAYPETIEEMDRELTKVIEDFERAVNVEALHLAKETGKHSQSLAGESPFSVVPCREGTFAWEAQICRSRLSPEPSLHGRHPQISPQGS